MTFDSHMFPNRLPRIEILRIFILTLDAHKAYLYFFLQVADQPFLVCAIVELRNEKTMT